jgi:hypothetical protein
VGSGEAGGCPSHDGPLSQLTRRRNLSSSNDRRSTRLAVEGGIISWKSSILPASASILRYPCFHSAFPPTVSIGVIFSISIWTAVLRIVLYLGVSPNLVTADMAVSKRNTRLKRSRRSG